eukprot:gene14115-20068_t
MSLMPACTPFCDFSCPACRMYFPAVLHLSPWPFMYYSLRRTALLSCHAQHYSLLYCSVPHASMYSLLYCFVKYQYYWLVDPLDGTKEFLKRNGEFTVNIALITNGTPVMEWTCRIVASGSHLSKETEDFIAGSHLSKETEDFIAVFVGSSLKLLMVAEGAADIYPRLAPTCEWDTGAADIIVREAGGAVLQETLMKEEPVVYNKEDILNPYFVQAPLTCLCKTKKYDHDDAVT